MSTLDESLQVFCQRVNSHPRMRSLLATWDRDIDVSPTDSDDLYRMRCRESLLSVVAIEDREPEIVMRAPKSMLTSVFSGDSNPAMLFLYGDLQVFATDRDQVKLDAIALILWD
jgi:hypothetical protein